LLKEWLEQQGHAVLDTGLSRSGLVGKSIKRAKEGHTLGRITLSLFYTTDFADRLENEIVPALRAGFVVLTDRYIYSLMARAIVRGLDPAWVRNIHRFALKPDAVFYLRIGVDELIPRAVFARGFDYWESGMDLYSTEDMFESFRRYQAALLEQFDKLAEEFHFQVIDARPDSREIFDRLRDGIDRVLAGSGIQKTAVADSPEVQPLLPAAEANAVVVPIPETMERAEDAADERSEVRRKKA
jgi:dTMP kinase